MKMTEIQRKLAKIVTDLDAVSQELWERSMGDDWNRLEAAITNVGQVCVALLDDKDIERLPGVSECVRPSLDAVSETHAILH